MYGWNILKAYEILIVQEQNLNFNFMLSHDGQEVFLTDNRIYWNH